MLNLLEITPSYDDKMELESILDNKNITTVYQPIVSLVDGTIIGYEALSRGPIGSPLQKPDELFKAAQIHNKTWELEQLCRIKAIERADDLEKNKYLFINVDPHIFKDEKFKKGFTKDFLAQHNMSPNSIIFEITEKTCIEDYTSFRQALSNYVDQGYKIAIDDTGSGYSGLKMLNETKPHFVKIDMDLIRNINEDSFKQSLVEYFVKLSEATNMKLIAEGIETEEELKTLIKLGVYAGQGFFINRPSETFLDISDSIKDLILKCSKLKKGINQNYKSNCIGEIVRQDKSFEFTSNCEEIKGYFDSNDITGACIVNNDIPVGLIMEHTLNSALNTQDGGSNFAKSPVSLVMDSNPLIVDYYTTINEVSRRAMSRKKNNIYDHIIITYKNMYLGVISVSSLLSYINMQVCNQAI